MHTVSEHRNSYIFEMMRRLGIEPAGGVLPQFSLSYATAFHVCDACPSKHACRDWLDHMPGSVSFAPRFCPNTDLLFELQLALPCAGYIVAERLPHVPR
jgi:hypothetical protein